VTVPTGRLPESFAPKMDIHDSRLCLVNQNLFGAATEFAQIQFHGLVPFFVIITEMVVQAIKRLRSRKPGCERMETMI
jgi:hypothetical protein